MQSAGWGVEAERADAEVSGLVTATVVDLVRPRICWVPDACSSIGVEAVAWARAHKMRLDPEQEFMLAAFFGLDVEGRWQAFEIGINAPRQNGKNEVLIARELFGVYELGERSIVHSAHEFKTSARHFSRMEQVIRSNPDLLARVARSELGDRRMIGFRYSHGDECIELESGAKIEFRTRTKSGMKGFDDVAVLVLDEAQILSEWAHGAMVPTMRASTAERGPQLVYSGNAADQEIHEHAIVWSRLRERGIAGDDDGIVYFEYSLDYDSPDEVPDEVVADADAWREVNWAIGRGRIRQEHMAKELKSLGRRQFAVELLGVGDYPETELGAGAEISLEEWGQIEDELSVLGDPVCLAFDVSPARRTSISAAGLSEKGVKQIELINSKAGTGWVPERFAKLCESHEVLEVACDGFGPANSIAGKIEEEIGRKVRRLNTGEYADACGMFANGVEERDFCHIGQEELTTAVRGARTRPLVDRWAWSRSKSRTDPGPLISSTIALWSAAEQDFGDVNIF